MEDQNTLYQVRDRIATITLNRPEKRNALNDELVQELIGLFDQAAHDEDVKVVVIKANGKAFCAGADLSYLQQLQKNTFEENLEDSRQLAKLFQSIYEHPKVVIGQIEGPAIAGGCGLANLCDFSFSTPEAIFGYSEVKIGFVPALVMIYLVRKIGEGRARDLLLSGKAISAEEAFAWGLINQIVDEDKIEAFVLDFASSLCEGNASSSMRLVKKMLARVQDLPLNDALDYAATMNAKARSSDDCVKGISTFLDKKRLSW
jgi:methylglutaconyl-CoA hydratase